MQGITIDQIPNLSREQLVAAQEWHENEYSRLQWEYADAYRDPEAMDVRELYLDSITNAQIASAIKEYLNDNNQHTS